MYNVVKNGIDPIGKILSVVEDEIDHHIHNRERWLGNGAVEDSLTGYTLTSGNGALGPETLILDTAHTPIQTGRRFFDLHRVVPLSVSNATAFAVRIIWGTGTVAAAEAAGQYSTTIFMGTGVGSNVSAAPSDVMMERLGVGTKVWMKCKNATNLATIVVLVGIHEYYD